MDLKEFYFQNIEETDYHYRFYQSVKDVNFVYNIFSGAEEVEDYEFYVFDAEEAITKFRELCQPDVNYDKEKTCWFYLITYYLYKNGYENKEFPRILARPPVEPYDFACTDIRNRIIALGKDDCGTVRYATRRAFVAGLTFEQKASHIQIDEAIDQKFVEISNHNASFNSMSTDEKLAEIANLIEHMLKQNGKFITPDYSKVCFDYITEDDIKSYRNRMHCFRHSSVESIEERQSYTEDQKNFFVDYGLIIVKAVHSLVK